MFDKIKDDSEVSSARGCLNEKKMCTPIYSNGFSLREREAALLRSLKSTESKATSIEECKKYCAPRLSWKNQLVNNCQSERFISRDISLQLQRERERDTSFYIFRMHRRVLFLVKARRSCRRTHSGMRFSCIFGSGGGAVSRRE